MVKSGSMQKKARKETINVESDDDMYDEVEKFHRDSRKIGEGKIKHRKGNKMQEVLNVEGDISSDELKEDDDSGSDFDSDSGRKDDSAVVPSRERWGKRRKEFYNAGYVDNDFGGVGSSDEEEMAELEETDAIARQKEMDVVGSLGADATLWDEETSKKEKEESFISKKSVLVGKKWKESNVKAENEALNDALTELKMRNELYEIMVLPLYPLISSLPKGSNLSKKLLLITDVYSSYLLNLTFFVKIKAESLEGKKLKDESVDEHAVVTEMEKFSKMIARVDCFLERNGDIVEKLRRRVENGKVLEGIVKENEIKVSKKSENGIEQTVENSMEEEDHDTKRGVSYAIDKNKGLQHRKKKGPGHSRAQKRKQYDKALVRRRSQVPDIRREESRYSGEARGIRVSTVKSTKLIA